MVTLWCSIRNGCFILCMCNLVLILIELIICYRPLLYSIKYSFIFSIVETHFGICFHFVIYFCFFNFLS